VRVRPDGYVTLPLINEVQVSGLTTAQLRQSLENKYKEYTTDPFVTIDPDLRPLDEVIARSDLLILCAPHSIYRELDFGGKPVVDVWGFLKNANVIA